MRSDVQREAGGAENIWAQATAAIGGAGKDSRLGLLRGGEGGSRCF